MAEVWDEGLKADKGTKNPYTQGSMKAYLWQAAQDAKMGREPEEPPLCEEPVFEKIPDVVVLKRKGGKKK